jgi:bifunctional ADP-heptose synthase (sugar kinase/adenylyltransferase)
MSHYARWFVVALLLFFSWKDSIHSIKWPPVGLRTDSLPAPPAELIAEASGVAKIAAKMLPEDRQHLSAFYDAMAFILANDGERAEPIVSTTAKFAALHAGSLNLAIQKKKVGAYPGLDKAIDAALMKIAGDDESAVDAEKRKKLIAACGVLSWVLAIHHE